LEINRFRAGNSLAILPALPVRSELGFSLIHTPAHSSGDLWSTSDPNKQVFRAWLTTSKALRI